MSAVVVFMMMGLFAIPWAIAGVIYPAAAGLKGTSRWRVFCYGCVACVALLAAAVVAAAVSGVSEPVSNTPSPPSDGEATLYTLWVISLFCWPFIAFVMRTKHLAANLPSPAEIDLNIDECFVEPVVAVAVKEVPPATVQPAPGHQRSHSQLPAVDAEVVFYLDDEFDDDPKDEHDDDFSYLHPDHVDPQNISFLYENAQGELSDRLVTVDQVGTSHFAGLCHAEGAERTFRFDRIQGHATLESTGELVKPCNLRDNLRGYGEQELRRRRRSASKQGVEILFTGFRKERRLELEALAESSGMTVRKQVTENLDFLCGGYNAGPTKLAEARANGVTLLNEEQFENLLETGEVPC